MWWRREEPALDRETVNCIIGMLMEFNSKLDRLLDGEEDDDAEEH